MPKESSVKFKVPKKVPAWVHPFFVYTENVKVYSLFEKYWEMFFNEHFVPPKPRKPQDPLKQFEKGVKDINKKLNSEEISEEEKQRLTESVSQMVSHLPDAVQSSASSASSASLNESGQNISGGAASSSRKRKRTSTSSGEAAKRGTHKKLADAYQNTRAQVLELAGATSDGDALLRVVDELYFRADELIKDILVEDTLEGGRETTRDSVVENKENSESNDSITMD